MRIEFKVAIIGSCTAIGVALIPIFWEKFVINTPEKVEVSINLDPEKSPYVAYKMKKNPPAFYRYKRASIGVFIAPELDLTVIIPLLNLGVKEDEYPTKRHLYSGLTSADPEYARRKKIQRVIELIGLAAKAAKDSSSKRALINSTKFGFSESEDEFRIGLKVLRGVFFGDGSRLARSDNKIVNIVRSFAKESFNNLSKKMKKSQDLALLRYAKLISTREIYPVFSFTIINKTSNSIVLNKISFDTIAIAPALSGINSGKISSIDTVVIKIVPNLKRNMKYLKYPIKIAPRDSIIIDVKLISDTLFGYYGDFVFMSGDKILAKQMKTIIDIGFQPPTGTSRL